MQINIPTVSPSAIAKSVDGYKTYIALASGAAVIALNHFGLLPDNMGQQLHLDPANWIHDEYALLLGATGRSAIAKIEAAIVAKVFAAGDGAGPGSQPGGAIGG
jgi:hypothetical protein